MLKLADKKLSVYKGDYKPVEISKNGQKIASFKTVGMNGEEAFFENTYNAPITVYGKSGYLQGENLCPPPITKEKYVDGSYPQKITAKENGYFDVEGTGFTGFEITKAPLKAGTYTASGCSYCSVWWEEKGEFLSFPCTFTLDKQTEVLICIWYTLNVNLSLENQYIQIEKGTVATEYVPFMGNSDFPPSISNTLKLANSSGEIKVESGNLLPPDFDNFFQWQIDKNSSINNSRIFELDLSPGEYRLTFNVVKQPEDGSYGYLYLQESDDNWQTHKAYYEPIQATHCNKNYKFTAKKGFKYRFWFWSSINRDDLFEGWQLQKYDIPEGEYLYFPSYKAKITLSGIEVTETDEYNYSEISEGQKCCYVSDIMSGDLIKRNVGSIKITGQEAFLQRETESGDYNCFYCDLSHIISKSRKADKFLSNLFEALDDLNAEKEGAMLGDNDTNLYFLVSKKSFSTIEDFVSWLENTYQNGNGVEIKYILDSEKTEPSNLDVTLKSFPVLTRIFSYTNQASIPLGLEKCVKIQEID